MPFGGEENRTMPFGGEENRHPGGLGMTPAEMEAEAQLSEIRVEALQQLTSALSGSRISLPPDDGAPSQLLWHSPTYGAGQQLLPAGIPANTLPPTAGVDH